MYMSLLVPCALVACAYALMWLMGRRSRSMLAGLPTYPQLPFLGNIHQVLGNSRYLVNVIAKISKTVEETKLPLALWIGPVPVVVFCDPDDVKAVTNAFIEKPYYYSFASEWVGNGLVTAPGQIWKHSIKTLGGTFTGNIVNGYQDVFNAQASKLVEKLKGEVGREPFDALHKYLAYTSLETVCQTALGVPCISESIVTTEYHKAFNRVFELFIQRATNLLLHLDFFYRLTPAHKELMSCIDVLHKVSNTVIKRRTKEREKMKKNGILSENSTEEGRIKFKPFLDILLDLSETDTMLTQQQIRSEVDTIIVAGQETVATTLAMSLLMIGCKPDVQRKLYAEMKEIFGDSNRSVQKEDLPQMKYCEAIIYETLRIFPPVPFIMREADRDLELKSCTIPKGTVCGINAWGAARSKRAWGPDADVYRPERWLQDEVPGYPLSFFAFSYGKRSCIGKKYAMALLKTILAYCIRELEITSEADTKLQMKLDCTLKPFIGNLIQVCLRKPSHKPNPSHVIK